MKRSRISAGSAVFILIIFCIPILVFTLVGTAALQADPLGEANATSMNVTPPPFQPDWWRNSPHLVRTFLSADGEWRTMPKTSPEAECRGTPRRLV